MSKTKTLSILVGVLALINIGLLIFLMIGRPKGPRPYNFGNKDKADMFIQKKFGFDKDQMKSFSKSRQAHRNMSQNFESELRDLSTLFYTVESNDKQVIRDSLMKEIIRTSERIYMNNVKHFDEVREICKPEQLSEMKGFVHGLMKGKRR